MMEAHRVVRSSLWQQIGGLGLEHCTLSQSANGEWSFAGVVALAMNETPAHVTYTVTCDSAWRTRLVQVRQVLGDAEASFDAVVEAGERWRIAGQPEDAIQGCLDVDLGVSPATNTLPIRRLALAVGDSAEVTAAWVRFPALSVEPLWQRYTRLEERRYRYESASGFSAELVVDELGLVTQYAGGWERVAVWDGSGGA